METAMRMKKTKLNGVFTSILEKNHYLKVIFNRRVLPSF